MEKIIEDFKRYYFENKEKFIKENKEEIEKLRNEFIDEYPIDRFKQMKLEEYAVGRDNKDSFGYKLEFGKYSKFGPNVGGVFASKYGIYYSKDNNCYKVRDEISSNPEADWNEIKLALVRILESIENASSPEDIKDNDKILSGMPIFISKLTYCYYPDKFMPFAGRKNTEKILSFFEIPFNNKYSTLQLSFYLNIAIKEKIPELKDDENWIVGNMVWNYYWNNLREEENKHERLGNKVWIYAPGNNASEWNRFYNEGIIAIGWDELGNLLEYESQNEIAEELLKDGRNGSGTNDAKANWEFANTMKIGDIVYAKKGKNTVVGKGIVTSEYYFDENAENYKSRRKINWTNNEEKNHSEYVNHKLVLKTLTDISKYPSYVEKLSKMYEEKCEEKIIIDNSYTQDDLYKEVFLTEEKINVILDTLKRKKNIILQGTPGVGKTFCAKKIMYALMGEKEDSRIRTVQFHQSYSYEDFIQGFRPNDDGKFELKNGIFYELVQEARTEYEDSKIENREPKKYCIIIDEINRGNLSKVFGELMMLIESDKRSAKWAVNLTYSDDEFYIPENLYIIGTMNTADRSLAMIDYALRRRFAFIDLEPAFDGKKFKKYLVDEEKVNEDFVDKLISNFKKLNSFIEESLGKKFLIGHSYFVNQFNDADSYDECKKIYNGIIEYEIKPLLDEYYFDNQNKVNDAIEIINNI